MKPMQEKVLDNKISTMNLTLNQKKELSKIWFVYGNNGKKHSHCNHRYIQNLIQSDEDTLYFYLQSPKHDTTLECIEKVAHIIHNVE